MATGSPGGKAPGKGRATAINTDCVNLDHCLELVKKWHTLRSDFEDQLYALTKDTTIKQIGRSGKYKSDIFDGHCNADGNDGYVVLAGKNETFARVHELYEPH
jgi:hypothetical protein